MMRVLQRVSREHDLDLEAVEFFVRNRLVAAKPPSGNCAAFAHDSRSP